jgi:hypothetical protein
VGLGIHNRPSNPATEAFTELNASYSAVAGFEANGGFLLA